MRRTTQNRRRAGFTLVEMLVTTMVMLIMVLAMSQMFALIGDHVTDGRALIEMQGQLRASAFRVQEDLDGLTALARTSPGLDWEVGYIEYIEGVDLDVATAPYTIGKDSNPWFVAADGTAVQPSTFDATFTAYGDIDDVLMFTARSTGRPFVGRIRRSILTGNPAHHSQTAFIESQDAEIIYWTQWNDVDGNGVINLGEVSLYRRALLIRPDLNVNNMPTFASLSVADMQAFYNQSDLSVRLEAYSPGSGQVVRLRPNSLVDLTKRENRVAHMHTATTAIAPANLPLTFPVRFNRLWLPQHFDDTTTGVSSVIGPTGLRAGEDIVQSDVLAFDVRVFDATAPLRQAGASGSPTGDLLSPGDWGWSAASNIVGRGAFVDLAYDAGSSGTSLFSEYPASRSGLYGGVAIPTFDTWTWYYEHDGIDQDNDGLVDEGSNGIDDDNQNGVDDAGERETHPPYSTPLRGLKVTLRAIELDSRQVRQTSVVSKLSPE